MLERCYKCWFRKSVLALLNAIGSLVAHDVDKTTKSSIQSVESDQTFCAAPKVMPAQVREIGAI